MYNRFKINAQASQTSQPEEEGEAPAPVSGRRMPMVPSRGQLLTQVRQRLRAMSRDQKKGIIMNENCLDDNIKRVFESL